MRSCGAEAGRDHGGLQCAGDPDHQAQRPPTFPGPRRQVHLAGRHRRFLAQAGREQRRGHQDGAEGVQVSALEEEGAYAAKLAADERRYRSKTRARTSSPPSTDAVVADKKLETPPRGRSSRSHRQGSPFRFFFPSRLVRSARPRRGYNWPPIINLSEAGGYISRPASWFTPSFCEPSSRTVVVDSPEIADPTTWT